jgi:exodeoxyribonuclease VII small subunit
MSKQNPTKTYQQMANQLAGLIEWFESDQVNLDEAVVKYQQAMDLLKEMEEYLKTAENKIKKISLKFDGE